MKYFIPVFLIVTIFFIFNSCGPSKSKRPNEQEVVTQDSRHIKDIPDQASKTMLNSLKIFISDNNVRLRTEPNLSSETLYLLPINTEVIIIEASEKKQIIDEMNYYWYKIQVPTIDKIGWVYGGFVVNDYGLHISNAKLFNSNNSVKIYNKAMGYEGEFPTNRKYTEPVLFDLVWGFAIGLPVTNKDIDKYYVKSGIEQVFIMDKPKHVVVTARYKDFHYSVEYDLILAEFDSANIPNCFYIPFIPFENKYWINPTGIWTIEVSDQSGVLFKTTYKKQNNALFYLKESDSPFDIINIERNTIKRNTQYTYRYFANEKKIVLLCYSFDNNFYNPIYMMISNETSNDKKIFINWLDNANSGTYAFFEFLTDEIPTKEVSIPVWGSLNLE